MITERARLASYADFAQALIAIARTLHARDAISKAHDESILVEIMPEAGAIDVMDRGSIDFQRLFVFASSSSFFEVHAKSNVPQQRRRSHAANESTSVRSLRWPSWSPLNPPLYTRIWIAGAAYCTGYNRKEVLGAERQPASNPTNSQCHAFRENSHSAGVSGSRLRR